MSYRSRSTNDLLSRAEADDARSSRAEKRAAADNTVENSKWIHRDKLARIECAELQAAGIMLPRAIPRPRKDRSTDRLTSVSRQAGESPERAERAHHAAPGAHAAAHATTHATTTAAAAPRPKTRSGNDSVSSWDLRTPDETAGADGSGSIRGANGSAKSRIPVPKFTPPPPHTPLDDADGFDLESTVASHASKDSTSNLETATVTTMTTATRARSRSTGASMSLGGGTPPGSQSGRRNTTTTAEASPKKPATSRKNTATKSGAAATPTAASRPKTRGNDRTSSGTGRPATRSGDLSPGAGKKPEGEPPWMVSAYKPDPRLPPDQQLLPTVARRLKQEQWEKEGKFGNVYDKEFRPLTDEGFATPPDPAAAPTEPVAEPQEMLDEPPAQPQQQQQQPQSPDWPLKQEPASPRPPPLLRGNSYSTMPKIADVPVPGSPIAPTSPRLPQSPLQRQSSRASVKNVIRVPDALDEPADAPEGKGKSCGLCCVVM
jgi:hypothetical protein